MAFSPRVLLLSVTSLGVMSAPAVADTGGEAIDMCMAELEAQTAKVGTPVFKFKGMRGASVKKVKFTVRMNDNADTVICKVKRGEITEIEWPAFVSAALETSEIAEAL